MFYVSPSITSALKPLEPEAVDSHVRDRKKDAQSNSKDHPTSDHSDDSALDTAQDSMSVLSVKALILFLEDFIEAHIGAKQQDSVQPAAAHFQPWMRVEHSNANHPVPSVKAANAYSHVSQAVKSSEKSDHTKHPAKAQKLTSIYALLRDLRALQSDKVQFLKIQNDVSFIEGILLAVQDNKDTLQP